MVIENRDFSFSAQKISLLAVFIRKQPFLETILIRISDFLNFRSFWNVPLVVKISVKILEITENLGFSIQVISLVHSLS